MEGNLWKWTNYFSGWQPRWFVLENDILSYYRSQEDVINGCKGSIKMSVCDVTVHQTDNTRLDLSIPGEAHFYVKAATPQERQEWLIALGSCKAGQHHSTTPTVSISAEVPDETLKSKKSELRLYCDLLMQQVHSVKLAVQDRQSPDIQQLNEASSLLSATCDTFINTLDECVSLVNSPLSPTTSGPHSPGLRDGQTTPTKANFNRISPHKNYTGSVQRSTSVDSSNVNMSSDEDGIVRGYVGPKFRNQRLSSKLSTPHNHHSSQSSENSPQNSPSHSKRSPLDNGQMSTVHSDSNLIPSGIPNGSSDNRSHSLPVTPNSSRSFEEVFISPSTSPRVIPEQSEASHIRSDNITGTVFDRKLILSLDENEAQNGGLEAHLSLPLSLNKSGDYHNKGSVSPKAASVKAHPEDSVRDPIQTFFSAMEVSFQDIKLFEDAGIPTTQFLSSCREVLPVFDKLNPTNFAPIKMEFTGNVRKIQQKYSTDPDQFITLQNIVLFEVKKGHHVNANSATVALLWLKRGLEFIREFLLEYMTGIQDLNQASNNAYCRSLKPFHSYVLRGVFALAAKSAPAREVFTQSLSSNPFHTKRANFEQILLRDIEAYVTANDVVLKILNDFYTEYDLDSKEQM